MASNNLEGEQLPDRPEPAQIASCILQHVCKLTQDKENIMLY